MRVARLHGKGDVRIGEEPDPVPRAGETVVRIKAVGLCGSDRHWFEEGAIGDAALTRPLVLGHELAGVLEDGRRVAIDPALPCVKCEECLEGNPNLCPNVRFAGHGLQDGGLCELLAWPDSNLYPLPDSIGYDEAAVLEPLGVAIHAFDLSHWRPGMTVGVFGCGPIGLLAVQLARVMGAAEIYATDILPHRLAAASAAGAAVALDATSGQEWREILERTKGRGVDVAFEFAGVDAAIRSAMAAVRPGARVLLGGIPEDDRTTFSASLARRKGLTLVLVRRMKRVYPRAIELVERGVVTLGSMITHRFPLSEVSRAFQVLHERSGIKVIVKP